MMRAGGFGRKGSGLVIALGVLAMISIMATTFITLMRLDTRVTANYVDDLRCEMLAYGTLNYFKGLLRDDLDRTWGKYENRDSGVGAVGWAWSNDGGAIATNIPGLTTPDYGTPICNDFWFNPPFMDWTHWGGIFTNEFEGGGVAQQSFAGRTGYSQGTVARYYDAPHSREFDMWVGRTLCAWRNDGSGQIVHVDHPEAGAEVDFDGDGVASVGKPYYWYVDPISGNGWWAGKGAFTSEEESLRYWYYDTAPFVLFSGDTYFYPGTTLTGDGVMPGGLFWRWAIKLGVAHASYLNLNMAGNLLGKNTTYLNNIGRLGLRACRAVDEDQSLVESYHLGRLRWKGFDGEFEYQRGGFPAFFNEVGYHPSQVSLEKLFKLEEYSGVVPAPWEDQTRGNLSLDRQKARDLIAYRLGPDGNAGDGGDDYRPGWRQDGATYYKFVSPENPLRDDRFFGVNDVIEHDRSVDHPGTSAIAKFLTDEEWRRLRPFLTMWSTDTILRGKIWPTEGCRYQGDWRHIDILKRVNINIIGAKGPDGLPYEDAALKSKWAAKRVREQNRLFTMLVAGMNFSGTAGADQKACQFIASLTDMVDRDRDETYYVAPTGTAWALGVEKHPVINEVVYYARNANTADYQPAHFRIELYNPMENIPWIPDADEAYDISDYRLRINTHVWRLGEMWVFGLSSFNTRVNTVGRIPADGMYGHERSADEASWTRYLHIGWDQDWPAQITKDEVVGGLTIELWKPLAGDAALNVPLTPGSVETVQGAKCLCVDRTPLLRLMPPLQPGQGPGGTQLIYTGCYRRWDPMNAKIYYPSVTDPVNRPRPQQYETCSVVWVPGWGPAAFATLGKPNVGYPAEVPPRTNYPNPPFSKARYYRWYERNFKIVDGDLPSIGWLGELIMYDRVQNGPLTWVHQNPQEPGLQPEADYILWKTANQLDTKAKFDLFRPFQTPPIGEYHPVTSKCKTENLQMLDIFTVWDPSNDGIDNDGDGAVDDDDDGRQPGDKYGPEIRVFGRVDLNLVSRHACRVVFPDSPQARGVVDGGAGFCGMLKSGRMHQRISTGYGNWGPMETLGDMLRADPITYRPGTWLAGGGGAWQDGAVSLSESGFRRLQVGTGWDASATPDDWFGDDDGDGIFDERDERDMLFTWVSNYLTTRSNVFGIDLVVDLCEPPGYPELWGEHRKLAKQAFKTRRTFAQKQLIGVLDRSTCLRINADGTCEFTGPVEVRLLRFSDETRVY